MQRLGGGAAAVVRQESSPRRLCAQHHACGARQLDPVMGNRTNTTAPPKSQGGTIRNEAAPGGPATPKAIQAADDQDESW